MKHHRRTFSGYSESAVDSMIVGASSQLDRCELMSDFSEEFAESQEASAEISEPKINHKESNIECLFEFLGLQSFDGKFLPNESFYVFFYKNDLNDFMNLKQEIEKEIEKDEKIEEILSTCISMSYLKIIMFEKFKDECEMCYEKADKVLKKMVKNEEEVKSLFWIINNQSSLTST